MRPSLSILLAVLIAFACGCGHSQRTAGGGNASANTAPADDGSADDGGADDPTGDDADDPADVACRGYARAVASVAYGPGAGFGQSSFPDIVLGPPEGAGALRGGMDVLSLGTGGEIVLNLGDCAAVDGEGDDIIIFENAFLIGGDPDNTFAEPAVVGVSDDGEDFVEFPCDADAFPFEGCAGVHPVYSSGASGIDPFDPGVAGGDAFDLSDVGLERARFIRVRDAGNSGGGGAAGFDLDAVAVINGSNQE